MIRVVMLVVLSGIAFFWLHGCDKDRIEVAADNLQATVDDWLGKHKVLRKKLERQIAELKGRADALQEARIRCEVRADTFARELGASEERKVDLTAEADGLRNKLAALSAVSDPDAAREAKRDAERAAADLKALGAGMKAKASSRAKLLESAERLAKLEHAAAIELAALRGKLDAIDSELIALETVRQSAPDSGGDPRGLTDLFEQTKKTVADLETEAQAGMRVWEERLTQAGESFK